MGLRKVRGGHAMNEHELFAAALKIDTPDEGKGR
jgi:hypothetical protein